MKRLILADISISRCWLMLLLLVAILVAGCQGAPQSPVAAPVAAPALAASTTFAGIIPGTDRFVALVSNGQRARAYVCDGDTVAEWFNGEVHDDLVDLTSVGGARLQAALGAAEASGSFTPAGGTAVAFTAEPVSAPAGLYRAEENIDGVQYVGGWIVLQDGRTQGAIRAAGDNPVIAARRAISIPFAHNNAGVVAFPTDLGDFQAALIEVTP